MASIYPAPAVVLTHGRESFEPDVQHLVEQDLTQARW
jgi:hypothetical protein